MGVIGMNDAGRIGFLIRGEYSDLETYDFLDIVYYNESSYVAKKTSTGNPPHRNNEFWQIFATGGGSATGGVTNYSELENLPKINNVTLNGNKSLEDLGVPTKTSGLVNDSGFKTTDTWKQNTANSEGYVEKGTGHANRVWKTDANGVPGWRPDANTTYGDVTASAHGLMTASDKTKLDGIAAGANKTTLTKSLAVTKEGVSALDGTVGKILDSKISELNDNLVAKLGGLSFGVTSDGQAGYRKPGADAVTPFSSLAAGSFTVLEGVNTIELGFKPSIIIVETNYGIYTKASFDSNIETIIAHISTNARYLADSIIIENGGFGFKRHISTHEISKIARYWAV